VDRLCTPWRYAYVSGQLKEEGCVFCTRLGGDDAANFVLYRGRCWYVILNLYPYNNGHLLLVLNRHAGGLTDLAAAELTEMGSLLAAMERSLRRVYAPQGINCGYNAGASAGAGVPDHFHLHMLPRWAGDTSFMTTVGGTRVMPETLPMSWERLRPVLAEEAAR
jgi:ATP adenylyltransferase